MQTYIDDKDLGLDDLIAKRKAAKKILDNCKLVYNTTKNDICYIWQGNKSTYKKKGGNRRARIRWNGRLVYPHRLIYVIFYGDIPKGYDIHHDCGNPLCCNPYHLIEIEHNAHVRLHQSLKKYEQEHLK
jgi:hypothetical protein